MALRVVGMMLDVPCLVVTDVGHYVLYEVAIQSLSKAKAFVLDGGFAFLWNMGLQSVVLFVEQDERVAKFDARSGAERLPSFRRSA